MSSTTKKGGSTAVSQKTDKNDIASAGSGSKGDTMSTTPSKSSKQGVTKKAAASSTNKGGSEPAASNPILNHQALEALYSATYVEDFIECNDNMGDDLIRQTTRMFEMGSNYMTYIRELESAMAILLGDDDADDINPEQLSAEKKKAVFRLQQVLMTAQDTGDDSLQVMQGVQDHIENKTRQLDLDRKNLAEFCKEQDTQESTFKDPPPPTTERNIKRARRVRHEIYRPSILGPSSLKATSYPETVSHNTRERDHHHHETPVVTSSRSRDRGERDRGDRDSQKESSNQNAATTAAAQTTPTEGPVATVNEQAEQKPNGRSSERAASSSRASAAATSSSATDHTSSNNEKSERSSSSGYTSSSAKKQSQKNQTQEKKTKKRKAKQSSSNSNSKEDNSPQQYAIDPDEPTYCLCDQVSYGEMIGCDNDLCPIEWFHFSCVSLSTKPKGKWYCPKCRGDRPNVMKPKAIFLKELEKYNREKEEKA